MLNGIRGLVPWLLRFSAGPVRSCNTAWLAATLLTCLTSACTAIREIRDRPPTVAASALTLAPPAGVPSACNVGSPAHGERRDIIEDYGEYELAFAEFDDQGWSYQDDRQLAVIKERLRGELQDPRYRDYDFVVPVFVHGWHHNAHDNDCNVQEVRQMLRIASEQFDAALHADPTHHWRKRHLFGIYVGWRGESVNAFALRAMTVIDRRDAAEKVAKGSIRQLFADLHNLEQSAQAAAADRSDKPGVRARMYTLVVGHSFGGLIVFNALSEEVISDLSAAADNACKPGAIHEALYPWPDGVVLINPAFEATRFEPVNRIADRAAGCGYAVDNPTIMVITADNDGWTGPVFTMGRRVLTLFEGYEDSTLQMHAQERDANLRTIGFVNRYRTHRLCLSEQDYATVSEALTPESTADAKTLSKRAVWVIGAPPDIVNGHDGFLYARQRHKAPAPYLLNWLVNAHVGRTPTKSPPNTCGPWRAVR